MQMSKIQKEAFYFSANLKPKLHGCVDPERLFEHLFEHCASGHISKKDKQVHHHHHLNYICPKIVHFQGYMCRYQIHFY